MSEFVSTLLKWIIGLAAVALILWVMFNPTSGKLSSLSRLVLGLETNIPNKEEPIITKQPQIPQNIIAAQTSITNTIKTSLTKSSNKNLCLVKIDLGSLQDYGMVMTNNNGINTRILSKEYSGQSRANLITVPNAKICQLNTQFFDCITGDMAPCAYNQLVKPLGSIEIYSDSAVVNGNKIPVMDSLMRIGNSENICIISEEQSTSGCDRTKKIIGKGCINELISQNKLANC